MPTVKTGFFAEEIWDSYRDQQEIQYQNKKVLNGTVPDGLNYSRMRKMWL
jgi:hypothetical protein